MWPDGERSLPDLIVSAPAVIKEAQSVRIPGIGTILAASLPLSGSMDDVWFVRSSAHQVRTMLEPHSF